MCQLALVRAALQSIIGMRCGRGAHWPAGGRKSDSWFRVHVVNETPAPGRGGGYSSRFEVNERGRCRAAGVRGAGTLAAVGGAVSGAEYAYCDRAAGGAAFQHGQSARRATPARSSGFRDRTLSGYRQVTRSGSLGRCRWSATPFERHAAGFLDGDVIAPSGPPRPGHRAQNWFILAHAEHGSGGLRQLASTAKPSFAV